MEPPNPPESPPPILCTDGLTPILQFRHCASRRCQDPTTAPSPPRRSQCPSLQWYPPDNAHHRHAGRTYRPMERKHPRRAPLPHLRRLTVPHIPTGYSPHHPFRLARPRKRAELPRRGHSRRARDHIHISARPPPNTFRRTGRTAGPSLSL